MKFNCLALLAGLLAGYTLYPSIAYSQPVRLVGNGAIGRANQGASVTLSADGNTAAIGGPDDHGGTGAVWVFMRSPSGPWTQQKLVGPGGAKAAQGSALALSGDGSRFVVGGPADDNGIGAAWAFTRSGGSWVGAKLVGTGGVGASRQGEAVAISRDGDTIIVGGPADNGNVGTAWVFAYSGGSWTQQAKLIGAGATGASRQGRWVALDSDGGRAMVQGIFNPTGGPLGTPLGGAWLFTRAQATWTQQGRFAGARGSISLSDDGSTALVGVITPSGQITAQLWLLAAGFQSSLPGISGPESLSAAADRALVAEENTSTDTDTGAGLVYRRNGNLWQQQTRLFDSAEIANAPVSVALAGDARTAIIGQPSFNNAAGAAWVFDVPPPGP